MCAQKRTEIIKLEVMSNEEKQYLQVGGNNPRNIDRGNRHCKGEHEGTAVLLCSD